jgi:PKD repeat protein
MKNSTNFKIYKSFVIVFIIGIIFCFNSFGQTVTCPVSSDCWINDYSPNTNLNYGSLWVGTETNPDNESRSLIKFNLSSIPSDAIILSAEMKLTYATTQETIGVDIHRLTSSWNENTITWNTTYSWITIPYGTFTTWHTNPCIYVPLTDAVIDWIENGYNNYGILLKISWGSGNCNFESKESASSSSDKPSLEVTYIELPVADFYGTPTSGTASLTVQFFDQSINSPISWSWNFGDGNTSSQQNPSHTYINPGNYTVSLTVSNSYGSDNETKSNYIHVDGPSPVADFYGTPTSGTAPLTVQFFDQSINSPTSWSWNFGDGNTSSQQNPSHTYINPGNYTVSLTSSNSYGSDNETKSNYIHVDGPSPVADFYGTPISGTAPLIVQFYDQSTNSPTSWSWNFGDGNTSSQQNPSYTYINSGNYTVSLTASNSYGSDNETKSNYIHVDGPSPVADFYGAPTSGTAPLTVQFYDQSINSPTSWSWHFGDGNIASQQNPSYTYINSGNYTVSLTATNSYGSDTEAKYNYIVAPSGIEDIDFISFISIHPNPNTGEFVIEIEFTKPTDLDIELLNVIGQVIYEENLNKYAGAYKKSIDVGNNETGIYILQLITEKGTINKKIIIE